jgi:hypothetical protein
MHAPSHTIEQLRRSCASLSASSPRIESSSLPLSFFLSLSLFSLALSSLSLSSLSLFSVSHLSISLLRLSSLSLSLKAPAPFSRPRLVPSLPSKCCRSLLCLSACLCLCVCICQSSANPLWTPHPSSQQSPPPPSHPSLWQVLSDILRLCLLLGRERTNNALLPLIITVLNDRRFAPRPRPRPLPIRVSPNPSPLPIRVFCRRI